MPEFSPIWIENTNVKVYNEKPAISTKDWTDAYEWNSQGHKIIQAYSTKNIYCTNYHHKIITKEQCRKYLQDNNSHSYTDFDNMMQQVDEFKVIKLNENIWENSECSCKEWHKFLKCNHIISLATRLKLYTFSTVAYAYSIPLTHKRRRGKPANTVTALLLSFLLFDNYFCFKNSLNNWSRNFSNTNKT